MKIVDYITGPIDVPGLYHMAAKAYHADPCVEPSLSSSIAKVLITQSPEHAWVEHPRLGKAPDDERDPTRTMEIGTAAHKLILGHGAELVIIDAPDYRTKLAKEARAEAYRNGQAPVLRDSMEKAETLADQVKIRLARIPGCEGFQGAPAEVVAIARDVSGAWLRIMMDRVEIHADHAIIYDVKTGDTSAAPQTLGRRVEQMGMEVQAAFYIHVLGLLFPHLQGRIAFRWIFIENDAPHGVCVAEADAAGLHVGAHKVVLALTRWNKAMKSGTWASYPTQIVRVEYPEWAQKRWLEREELELAQEVQNFDLNSSPFRPLDWEDAA
ncbi:PD-(D/E)XK nuclease-like domain-containing protein [Methylobacterium sp. V23]|uniref:PD-(D/E)XK nuclease family protein n=1 Tax=Methylobacterium sp. V23 TaxID=2044878 RepID=UPI000CDA9679|nr:PD-(D/E)XK nuclease-like domain-containing protein [Methylobacterium sp. V23]POR42528.1 hypothetical protein CRT23_12100 [Methylobacterium sp. V23]